MIDIHLAIPPNIVRKTTHDLKIKFPEISIRPTQTHPEMAHFFANDFGNPEKTADLTLSAYPSSLVALGQAGENTIFAPMPASLPPMRPELAKAGLLEDNPCFRVAAVVTLIIISHRDTAPFPKGWADLCHENIKSQMAIPPDTTPAPALYAYYMEKFCGEQGREAATKANKTLLPQDINNAVDAGLYKAGMVFPAFARTFRQGDAAMVWPEEGALTLPLLAFLKKDAPPQAIQVLDYIFERNYQTFLAQSGLFCSVREDVAFFEEMKRNNGHFNWMGWPDYCAMAASSDL
jgi:ABC-type Fe3+ transport system substrate-binding protein